jgi:hypothetical protein
MAVASCGLRLLTFHHGADQLANHCRDGAALRWFVYLILGVHKSRLQHSETQTTCAEQAPHCGVGVAAVVLMQWPMYWCAVSPVQQECTCYS